MYEAYQNRWGGVYASHDISILPGLCSRRKCQYPTPTTYLSCMKVKIGISYFCPDDSVFAASGNSWMLEAGMLLVFRESVLFPR
jgi:hypothetical protein